MAVSDGRFFGANVRIVGTVMNIRKWQDWKKILIEETVRLILSIVILIPLKDFFGDDPKFYPADITNIKVLQFDAEYNSIRGKIVITYIGLSN